MFTRDKKIGIDYSLILKNKVPLLINDDSWKKIFGNVNDKGLVDSKNELERLLSKQKEIIKELKKEKLEKKILMAEILRISDEVNNKSSKENIEILNDCKKRIALKNEEIDELTFEDEMMPRKIKEGNYNLLVETIRYSYRGLREEQIKLELENERLKRLRIELRETIENKHNYEEKINNTYSFLHGMIGNEEMEKLDRNLL